MGNQRRTGGAVALVIFRRGLEKLFAGFAEGGRLVEKDDGLEGAFGEFEERTATSVTIATEPRARLPGLSFLAARSGHAPFRKWKDGGFGDGRNGALGARIEFANGFDRIAEKFDAHWAWSFGREDVDDAAADGELARKFNHFGARVAGAGEMGDELLVRNFGVFREDLREGEVDVGILVAPQGSGYRRNNERDFAIAETVEGGGATLENIGVWRLRIPRETIEGGENDYAPG